jgi:uncharacterized protein
MSRASRDVDVVVVGGGPSGLVAAYRLTHAGLRVAVLEAGGDMRQSLCPRVRAALDGRTIRDAERFRLQCARCTCLLGLGGAAFHFDTDLGYVRSLSRSKVETAPDGGTRRYSGLERAVGSFDRAQALVAEVYDILRDLGLPGYEPDATAAERLAERSFHHVDTTASQSVTVDVALEIVDGLCRAVEAGGGAVLLHHRVTDVEPYADGRFKVTAQTPEGTATLTGASVVLAAGKLGLPWIRDVVRRHGVAHGPATRVDVGVRLETAREELAPLLDGCHNPKLSFLNGRGESVRTFCVCDGGRVMQYAFLDGVALDGQHCLNRPTSRSNLGVVTSVELRGGEDGTEYARAFAQRVTERGAGRPVVCSVGELASGRTGDEPLSTSLIDYCHVSLRGVLPEHIVEDVLEMVARLNATHPGLISDAATVSAPVIERIFPTLDLSADFESSVPGLYFVGDASSKIIGITYGAATGLAAAESILRSSAATTEGARG